MRAVEHCECRGRCHCRQCGIPLCAGRTPNCEPSPRALPAPCCTDPMNLTITAQTPPVPLSSLPLTILLATVVFCLSTDPGACCARAASSSGWWSRTRGRAGRGAPRCVRCCAPAFPAPTSSSTRCRSCCRRARPAFRLCQNPMHYLRAFTALGPVRTCLHSNLASKTLV